MKIKTLIALLLILLVAASLTHAQDATVEAPTAEATVELIEPGAVEVATEEAHAEATAESAADDHSEDAETAAESETPAGSALLMLLLGVGVVVAVGGLTMLRSGNKS